MSSFGLIESRNNRARRRSEILKQEHDRFSAAANEHFCLLEESRDVEGAEVEADDREPPFRTIVVELAHAQWKREHKELKY